MISILLWCVLVLIGLFLAFLGWGYLVILKQIIGRQRMAKQDFWTGDPQTLPGYNAATVQKLTSQVESLGFEHLEDALSRTYSELDESQGAMHAPLPNPHKGPHPQPERFEPQGFGRLMRHPQHGCLCKIIFVGIADKEGEKPVDTNTIVTINSYDATGGGWVYSTSNRISPPVMDALMKLMRHPRKLSTRLPGTATADQFTENPTLGASPAELLQVHLKRREEIAAAAGITWKRTPTAADDRQYEDETVAHIRKVYSKLSPLSMAWKLQRLKKETSSLEWLGELKGKVPNSRA